MVFIEGTAVIAVDSKGAMIAAGTAGTDDAAVIQAAITYVSNGNTIFVNIATYGYPEFIKVSSTVVRGKDFRNNLSSIFELLGDIRLLVPCDRISGTSIADYTRLSNTLTAQASVATWYGFQGRATYYDFNGSSHYLYRANDTDFDFGNALTDSAFSIVMCLNPDVATSRQLIGKWDVNNLREWRFFFDVTGYLTLQLYDESVDKYIGRQYQTIFTPTGEWGVFVATYDGSTVSAGCTLYIDGIQVDNANYEVAGYIAMEVINTNLMVGALKNAAAYSEYYDGKMTWIGITGKELDADEVWSVTQRVKGVLGI